MYAPYVKVKGVPMIERSFEPSFSLKLAHKDAGLVLERPRAAGLELPAARRWSASRWARRSSAGHGEDDMSATFMALCPELS